MSTNCDNCDGGHDCNPEDEEYCQEQEITEIFVFDEDDGYCD